MLVGVEMITLTIPGHGVLTIAHLLLDVNGCIALDGNLLPGVAERLTALGRLVSVRLLTADTQGTAAELAATLGVDMERVPPSNQASAKAAVARRLGASQLAAIGNGANDVEMLDDAALGIAVIGPEGASLGALLAADVVVTNIRDALDLLLKEKRLVATLRR